MLGLPVSSVIDPRKLVLAPPEATVAEGARLMSRRNVGCLLIVKSGQLVGIFTERDVVYRVVALDRDPAATRIADVMTPDPKTVTADESFGFALLLMHENRFRHVPVMDGGRPIGVVSARHALDPDLEEFASEAERRKAIRRRA